jgi:hypothetical protein
MTVVCLWLDNSYGRERITLLADTRAAVEEKPGRWKSLDETTTKLFRVPLECHHLDSLDPRTGAWRAPYFQTTIGIGFAGYCFEALTIIAHITRCFSELVAYEGNARPVPRNIAESMRAIVERYFAQHQNPASQIVDLVAVGYSAIDGRPWAFKISHTPRKGTTIEALSMGVEDFHVLGSMATDDPSFAENIKDLRGRIAEHREKLAIKRDVQPTFELDLEEARHDLAERKIIEEETRKKIEDVYAHKIGGILQKMEVSHEGEATIISFTRDDRPHLFDKLPLVGKSLGFIPVIEKMGR